MTDFFSSYLFLCLAVIILVVALVFKRSWLFFVDFICWLFAGLYTISHQDATQPFILYLGFFFIVMAFATGFTGLMMLRKPKAPPLDMNDPDNWDDKL